MQVLSQYKVVCAKAIGYIKKKNKIKCSDFRDTTDYYCTGYGFVGTLITWMARLCHFCVVGVQKIHKKKSKKPRLVSLDNHHPIFTYFYIICKKKDSKREEKLQTLNAWWWYYQYHVTQKNQTLPLPRAAAHNNNNKNFLKFILFFVFCFSFSVRSVHGQKLNWLWNLQQPLLLQQASQRNFVCVYKE